MLRIYMTDLYPKLLKLEQQRLQVFLDAETYL